MWQKISKKLDVAKMTVKTIYIAYPSGQVSKLTLYCGCSAILATSLYTILNNNTPHSEQRRTVLIRQTVHARTRESSLLQII